MVTNNKQTIDDAVDYMHADKLPLNFLKDPMPYIIHKKTCVFCHIKFCDSPVPDISFTKVNIVRCVKKKL